MRPVRRVDCIALRKRCGAAVAPLRRCPLARAAMSTTLAGCMAAEEDVLETLDGRARPGVVRTVRLLDDRGKLVGELDKPRSSIGQQRSNDVVLEDRMVS